MSQGQSVAITELPGKWIFREREVKPFIDQGGNPWWKAVEVGEVLGLTDTKKSIKLLDEDERNIIPLTDALGRKQDTYIINEPGLYSLVLRSRKPEAKEFKRWITHDVIPSIRKQGYYTLGLNERLISLNEKIVDVVNKHDVDITQLKTRVNTLEQQKQLLPPVPEITPRLQVSEKLRAYAYIHNLEHEDLWIDLYTQFKYRYGYDIRQRARNSKRPAIEIVEQIGMIMHLLSLAVYLFDEDGYSLIYGGK